ncbi:MAG: VOC family protein [Proteobacteria bacterium]|nr:VOC family protein [Pseudomonadota bacterium]
MVEDKNRRPSPHAGLRHVALFVRDLDACVAFYTRLLGYQVEWHPDENNIYLCSGNDNLALHRQMSEPEGASVQRLDHIGILLADPSQVDEWYDFLVKHGVRMAQPPKTHRDGARSFYCHDPDGTLVQLIYHPPLSAQIL